MKKFNGRGGYVFDAYLSKFPTPKNLVWEEYSDGHKYLRAGDKQDWFKEAFGLLRKIEKKFVFDDYKEVTEIYDNGIVVQMNYSIKGGENTVVIPNFSVEEAYLIFNLFTGYEINIRKNLVKPEKDNYKCFGQSKNLLSFNMGLCSYSIKFIEEGKFAIISSECGC